MPNNQQQQPPQYYVPPPPSYAYPPWFVPPQPAKPVEKPKTGEKKKEVRWPLGWCLLAIAATLAFALWVVAQVEEVNR